MHLVAKTERENLRVFPRQPVKSPESHVARNHS